MAWNWPLSDIPNHSPFPGNSARTTNGTLTDNNGKPYINLFFAIFIPSLCFFITVGNLGTIIAFWKLPSLREKPSELLILSLSCADFITGFIVIPLFSPVYITPGYWPFKEITCRIFIFFMDLSVHASLFTLCSISIDRFLLVLKEYPQYMKIQSHLRIQTTLIIGWTFSAITGAIEVSMWEVAKELDKSASLIDYTKYCLSPPRRMRSFALTFFLTLYLLPVMLVCGLSTAFFCLLHQRMTKSWGMRAEAQLSQANSKQLQRQPSTSSLVQQPGQRHSMSSHQRNRYIKPAITLLCLVSAMALCMLPYCFHVIAVEVFCQKCADWNVLYSLLLLQFCNACLDPFMYALTQKKILTFYKVRLKTLRRLTFKSQTDKDDIPMKKQLALSSHSKSNMSNEI